MNKKRSQMFLIATVIISLSFLFLTLQISKLNQLNTLQLDSNYLIPINYLNNLLEDAYNNQLINWYYLDCKYRIKVLVLNPTVEGFRVIHVKNLVSNEVINTLSLDYNRVKIVDQYNRKVPFKIISQSNGYDALFVDYLNSYSSKFYYIYFNCEYPDPQTNSLEDINENNNKYYYNIYNIEYKELFEYLFPALATSSFQKETFSLLYFQNSYSITSEKFNNQTDWIYYQNVNFN